MNNDTEPPAGAAWVPPSPTALLQAAHPYLHPSVATFKHIYLYHSSAGKRGMVGLFFVQVKRHKTNARSYGYLR